MNQETGTGQSVRSGEPESGSKGKGDSLCAGQQSADAPTKHEVVAALREFIPTCRPKMNLDGRAGSFVMWLQKEKPKFRRFFEAEMSVKNAEKPEGAKPMNTPSFKLLGFGPSVKDFCIQHRIDLGEGMSAKHKGLALKGRGKNGGGGDNQGQKKTIKG
uniref:Uncharacterized protein n=1 Tax=Chromera velia CCMP2878 TaxID=1169474 RepID=A0A0G4GG22_9ALVE|mmetsp:Transcript_50913/g.100070  ORF Transcript_50913/g.100070 Transcript_50913/m.100070 type:complete len:159 (-) Transcript_50913:525-1001(-)|eukprot:Cvel_21676.t1-p1 / transcript=Cvel_21676.t1 / gene=Cvel_21676 / organism=Chromera_velia_CCMP2878 / gene_product=hypothetical protein / transcript_product=hypothetical protein / location=Cvel_scaffold2054:2499-2972(-) / protein_length=158 / sequence_SO=supercontig / SO=protein_coding / is_pseudo=false